MLLLVEDSSFQRKVIASMLLRLGVEIVDCETPEVGLEKLRNQHFDLIVTDLTLPVMSGVEFIRIVKEEKPDIPIVGITSTESISEDSVSAIEAGALFVLSKPLENLEPVEKLINKIRAAKDQS
ncbi:hypothetical protein A9Q84_21015 [Halobacteriovorax marinus]|uniref:Response regulatory domain-containing protein n=1 Tax=Halobacteriovorax marinus TaxID=97084 RepID=A0A1Y5F1G4_9BACT|nr:hypothetical protein A9Q84_21015 [Halobacteriovorax marinus]